MSHDNETNYRTGEQLLNQWGCFNREQKLEQACRALMQELNSLHTAHKKQNLKLELHNPHVFCSCADAYRMGEEALKP